MRRFPLLCVVLLALALVPAAAAAHSIRYGIEDDAWLAYGPGTLTSRLDRLETLGVRLVRYNVHWDQVAPTRPDDARSPEDPAYRWTLPDEIVDGLAARKIAIVLGLVGAPAWANGGRTANWAPTSGADFADFAYAVATRYPQVSRFLVWNEPNQARWLRPTSPAVYVAKLLNPAYTAIHEAHRAALVAGGVTAPRAATSGVSPVAWIAGMGAAGAELDAYAHHPYPSSPKTESPFAGGCGHCTTITMATIRRLTSSVAKAFGPVQIWLTEYGYQTNPPDRLLGVPPLLQAEYVSEGALRAWQTPRVTMLIQYLYRDEPGLDRFQSGLVYRSGAAKPALRAFELPFAQVARSGRATRVWGQIRQGTGPQRYLLQRLDGESWVAVGDVVRTDAAGFFQRTLNAPPGTQLRVWAPQAKLASLVLRVT